MAAHLTFVARLSVSVNRTMNGSAPASSMMAQFSDSCIMLASAAAQHRWVTGLVSVRIMSMTGMIALDVFSPTCLEMILRIPEQKYRGRSNGVPHNCTTHGRTCRCSMDIEQMSLMTRRYSEYVVHSSTTPSMMASLFAYNASCSRTSAPDASTRSFTMSVSSNNVHSASVQWCKIAVSSRSTRWRMESTMPPVTRR